MGITRVLLLTLPSLMGTIFLLEACRAEPLCAEPNAKENCGCAGPCGPDEECFQGLCSASSNERCGPSQLACENGFICRDGQCECDPTLTASDPEACGCPPVDCEVDRLDQEVCIDGVCACDPALHDDQKISCGCPPVICGDGEDCVAGACQCMPSLNQNNPANCNCEVACSSDRICQGRCICPSGTVDCGGQCIPLGFQCCSLDGDACPAAHTCQNVTSEESVVCQPPGTLSCYGDQGAYLGYCGADQKCVPGLGGEFSCVPQGASVCFSPEGLPVGTCSEGLICAFDGDCVPPNWTLCDDGITECAPGTSCQTSATGEVCPPVAATYCYDDQGLFAGYCGPSENCLLDGAGESNCIPGNASPCVDGSGVYTHFCELGYACAPQGCVPPNWTLCPSGEMCQAGTTCVLADDGWLCHPNGSNPCYQDGFYTGFCEAGYSCGISGGCVPPGTSQCADGVTVCGVGSTCALYEAGWSCVPLGVNVCYSGGYSVGWCENGHACVEYNDMHYCLPPGWSWCGQGVYCPPGQACQEGLAGYECQPAGTIPCFYADVYMGSCNSGWACGGPYPPAVGEFWPSGYSCMPANATPCYDDQGYWAGWCQGGFVCPAC